jgi:hypothetical protein
MSVSLPQPSGRLLRAASAERADLVRHRERLTLKRSELLEELRALDEALATADRRLNVLAELVGGGRAGPPEPGVTQEANPTGEGAQSTEGTASLRGPAIREAAVRVLLAQPEPIEALHYRHWYQLLTEAGHAIAGKDPLAVFLTQLSRSPVVRKSSKPGVYELDRQAPLRLRRRLERLQAELREVTVAAPGPVELAEVRARRHELDLAISQQERALEEALRVLGEPSAQVAASHA